MRVDVNGIGLEVEDRGSGPPVLLLHGWPDSHRLWRHQVERLTAGGFRTIAPDLRGFGASDRPAEVEAYGLLNIAGDVLGVLDHLGIERVHLVAHDLGVLLDEGLLNALVAIDVDAWTDYRDEMWTLAATFRANGGKLGILSNGVPEIVARIRADHESAVVVIPCG